MGIELPPELADVAAQAGVTWPEADEEAMTRQAQAWRDTATSMSTLATDADTTARAALSSISGETAEAASKEWKTFVEPDSGHLTAMVRDCNAAANRLEHAANQVGTAKVEIVRNLVALAQNQDAATAAAQAGHPFALAGMDTAVRGTAANVSHIESQLISAVQPTSTVDMATVQTPVNANPGHHLQPGTTTGATNVTPLADTATTLTGAHGTDSGGQLLQGVGDLARTTTGNAPDLVRHGGGVVGDAAGQVVSGAGDVARQGAADLVRHGGAVVGDTADQVVSGADDLARQGTAGAADLVRHGGNVVGDTADHVVPGAGDLVREGTGDAANLVQHTGNTVGHVPGAGDLVRDGAGAVGDTADQVLPGPGRPGDVLPGQPGDVLPDRPGGGPDRPDGPVTALPGRPGDVLPDLLPGDPEVTGPVPADDFPDGDVPTPPVGQTVQAGFAGGFEASAAPAPANLPPAAAAPPLNPAAPAPAFGGAPGFAGGPVAPVPPVAGAPAVGAPAPGAAPVAQPARPTVFAPAAPAAPAVAPAAPVPGDRPQDPAPRKQLAGPPGAPPPAKGERNEVLAAFWIHMFPIGHLPVASYRPARQLPPPPEELDYAAGLRFEPGDHPQFDLVDTATRLAQIKEANAHREATKAAAESSYQQYAPAPSPNYPPAPPAHPAEAVAAGYAPAESAPAYPASADPASVVPPGYPAPVVPASAVPPAYPTPAELPPAGPAAYPVPAASANPAVPATPAIPAVLTGAETIPNLRPITPSAGLTADHPTVQALLENHDPLGGGHERDWDRRYLVRLGSVTAHGISPEGLEYNWPTSEQYPEGGSASGEPEVLPDDTVIDRFGTPDGRVFAQDSTPFPQRSLPPAHKDTGYRRYKVIKPLPVWRAVSAAWFGQLGGGVRYRTTHSAAELVALGYLEEIA